MNVTVNDFKWTRLPADHVLAEEKIEIVTKPYTDLWQRMYYHFRNDTNMEITECKWLAHNGQQPDADQ